MLGLYSDRRTSVRLRLTAPHWCAGRTFRVAATSAAPAIIGRSEQAAVVLDDLRVSRLHCEILDCEGQLVLRDLGSRNGTYVNGDRIRQAPLHEGDVVTLGLTTLEVVRLRPTSRPADSCPSSVHGET